MIESNGAIHWAHEYPQSRAGLFPTREGIYLVKISAAVAAREGEPEQIFLATFDIEDRVWRSVTTCEKLRFVIDDWAFIEE
jgi:hypothetical protein